MNFSNHEVAYQRWVSGTMDVNNITATLDQWAIAHQCDSGKCFDFRLEFIIGIAKIMI